MRLEPQISGGPPSSCLARLRVALLVLGILLSGCHPIQPYYLQEDGDMSHYLDVATEIEYPDLEECPLPDVTESKAPITLLNPEFDSYWDLTLEEAISIALQNSKVFHTLGGVRQLGQVVGNPPGRVSQSPDGVPTIYDVAIQEAGQTGVEQALSNFDAVFRSTTTWDSSDRPQNFQSAQLVNSPVLQSDQVNINNEISKLTAGGSQFFFRNVSIYDGANNDLTRNTRAIPSSWFTALEAEVRHPLLRGRGVQLNRIPVILARMRTDTALADFQEAIETLLTEVETAYWELYFQYRTLDATRLGRDSALAAWQRVNALAGEPSGSRDREAQAREQYYTFKAALFDGLRNVQVTETRLRFLLGIASTDGRFIRPCEEPTTAKIEFDWPVVHCEALTASNELRRQRWRIKQRELELIAAKNQLLPQVDVVGLYRWLGVGDEFISSTQAPFPAEGSSAADGVLQGDHQEFRFGLSAELNVGFRREMAQVRAQQLALVRERARLDTSELEVVSQLTDAYQNLVANHELIQLNMNRRIAAAQQVEAAEAGQEQGNVDLFTLLNAQNRRADADTQYFRSIVEYNLALINLHRVKGSLLAFNNILMSEGPWPEKAYFDAQNLARQRDASYFLDYGYTRPRVSSRGPIDQFGAPGCEQCIEEASSEPLRLQPAPDRNEVKFGDENLPVDSPDYREDASAKDPGTSADEDESLELDESMDDDELPSLTPQDADDSPITNDRTMEETRRRPAPRPRQAAQRRVIRQSSGTANSTPTRNRSQKSSTTSRPPRSGDTGVRPIPAKSSAKKKPNQPISLRWKD